MTPAVDKIKARGKVTAILRNIHTGEERVYETHNIITNAGDVYYAQKAAGESPTNAFDTMWLGIADGSSAPDKGNDSDDLDFIANSAKTVKSGYPKTDDDDPDNTGADTNVVTWTFEWGAADFNNAAISDGMIGVGAYGASEPVLTHFEFTGGPFAKTSSDTLKVIVNHEFEGV